MIRISVLAAATLAATTASAWAQASVGAWSDAEIKRAITEGISRDGSKLKGPMSFVSYARMNRADLDAMVAWLRTLPAKE